jgi:hypothetical protein
LLGEYSIAQGLGIEVEILFVYLTKRLQRKAQHHR